MNFKIKIFNYEIMSDKYSPLSVSLTKRIDQKDKKTQGIFFTPPSIINKIMDILAHYMDNIENVLEPSCGSCEFVSRLNQKYPEINITGVELNKTIFDSLESFQNDKVNILNQDFLTYNPTNNYDLIWANPPYLVIKKEKVDEIYYDYFEGRPNLFILFLLKSLKLLNLGGILCYVLPKNFINCNYYNKTRKYINENFQILDLFECDGEFMETKQETVVLTVRNIKNELEKYNEKFTLNVGEFITFGIPENISRLKVLYENSTTLNNMNFDVIVGNLVWNQNRDKLTNDKEKTLLIYSSDIKNKELKIQKYKDESKKNYINKKGYTGPSLVVNRGYGKSKYNFNYCLLNIDSEYLIENHLICIKYKENIDANDLIESYNKIIKSFDNEKTKEFIKLYFGNNAINTTELAKILPIYDIWNAG